MPIQEQRPAGTVENVDLAKAEQLFFDGMCECIETREYYEDHDIPMEDRRECFRHEDCCDDMTCWLAPDAPEGTFHECTSCREDTESCNDAGDCCDGMYCFNDPFDTDDFGHCSNCREQGETCNSDADCCDSEIDAVTCNQLQQCAVVID